MATTSLSCPQHLRWKRSCQSQAQPTSSPVEQTRWGSKWKGFAVMPTCAFTRVQMWECTGSQCEGSYLSIGILSMTIVLNSVILANGVKSATIRLEPDGQSVSQVARAVNPFENIEVYSCYQHNRFTLCLLTINWGELWEVVPMNRAALLPVVLTMRQLFTSALLRKLGPSEQEKGRKAEED